MVTGEESTLDQRTRYGGKFVKKGLHHGEASFVSRCTKECKWPGRAGHGGPRKEGTIIEVDLSLVLWNQPLSNERG